MEVEIGCLDQHTNPDRAFGEGILHGGFYGFLTLGAVKDLDDMFGDDGLNFRDVFYKAFSDGHWLSKGREALGAMGKGVEFGFIDSFRGGSADSLVALLPAGPFLSPLPGRLFVGRLHARGGGRVILQGFLGKGFLKLFHLPIQLQELFNGRFFARAIEGYGLFFSQDG